MDFNFLNRLRKNKVRVSITAINLKIMGDVHGIDGRQVDGSEFTLDIPFSNKIGSDLLIDAIKGPDVVINGITVSEPFELVSVNPQLPARVPFKEKVVFNMRIKVPEYNYSGPMTIEFKKDATDSINISVRAIVVSCEDRRFELPESSVITTMQKSQIFRRDIQVYKVMRYGETVNKVDVNKPFKIINTEPRVPFTIDRKDSYIISLYIQAPDQNYAGDMEIRFTR